MLKIVKKLWNERRSKSAFSDYLKAKNKWLAVAEKLKQEKKYKSKKVPALQKEHDELFDRKNELMKMLVDIEQGLFVGVGVKINKSIVDEIEPVYLDWKKLVNHYFVYGTTQVGKSRMLAGHIRQVIMNDMNLVVVDPKGGEGQEILSWTVEFAGEAGREEDLFFINPAYPEHTNKFNPLYLLGNEEIASLARNLTKSGKGGGDEFFADLSYTVILSILYCLEFLSEVNDITGEISRSKLNEEIVKYYKMLEFRGRSDISYDSDNKLANPDIAERLDTKPQNEYIETLEEKYAIDRKLVTFKELAYYSNYENLMYLINTVAIHPVPSLADKNKQKRLKFLKNESNELVRQLKDLDKDFFFKVSTSLSTLLSQLSTGKMGQLLCSTRINPLINRLHREDKGLICVVQPAPLKFQKVSDMVMKILIKMFESLFGTIGSTGRGITRRVLFAIDEAKAVMTEGIEELYNKAAQLGMTIAGFTQSSSDIVYKVGEDLAEVIRDNVNTEFFLRTNSPKSRESISNSFGTVRTHTYNYTGENSLMGGRLIVETVDEKIAEPHHLKSLGIGEGYMHHASDLYFLEFPYQDSPHGILEMPVTVEEENLKTIVGLEMKIENEMENIRSINNQYYKENGDYFSA